jgi:hypothetical protein
MRKILGRLKLTVNDEKAQICKVPEGEIGYTFGRMYSARTGKPRLGQRPSEETHQAHDRGGPCPDRPSGYLARDHGVGRSVEPRAKRMPKLLQRRQC